MPGFYATNFITRLGHKLIKEFEEARQATTSLLVGAAIEASVRTAHLSTGRNDCRCSSAGYVMNTETDETTHNCHYLNQLKMWVVQHVVLNPSMLLFRS